MMIVHSLKPIQVAYADLSLRQFIHQIGATFCGLRERVAVAFSLREFQFTEA